MAKRRVKALTKYTELSIDDARLEYIKKEPLRKQGQRFIEVARNNAPKKTGEYANALTYDYTTTKDGFDSVSCWGGKTHYTRTHLLENGTTGKYGQSAKPHMRPAHNKTKDKFGEDIVESYQAGEFIQTKEKKL